MKRVYLTMIYITLGLNVLLPWIFCKIKGFQYIYWPVDEKYLDIAVVFLILILLITIVIVELSRYGGSKIEFSELDNSFLLGNGVTLLFWFSIILNLINIVVTGGFRGIIVGAANSTIIAYLQFFLDSRLLYFAVLLKAYKRQKIEEICIYSFAYVAVSFMYSSRSGIFWMVFYNMVLLYALKLSKRFVQKIMLLMVVPIMLAPVLYMLATASRSDANLSIEGMINQIVGRVSYLEISAIEIEQAKTGDYVADVFNEKYGMENQAKQIVNMLVPGSVFQDDVQPNQYWRAIFAGWTKEAAKEHYTSMYFVLPVYLYVKYGLMVAVILYATIIYSLFRITCKMKNNAFALFVASYFYYSLFQFFDWVYHAQDIYAFLLTVISIKVMEMLVGKYKIKIGARKIFYDEI